jgi:chromosome segregation ATPase
MAEPPDIEARVSALEVRVEAAAADAKAARHLAAAHDRDLADLGVKVDANRKAINALGVQTAERFDRLEGRFDRLEGRFDRFEGEVRERFTQIDAKLVQFDAKFDAKFDQVDAGFAEMRHRFDQTAAGMDRIVQLLTDRDDG